MNKEITFFLGANTCSGFYSLYDWMYEAESSEEIYLIKGGPGTGKSRFMKRIAAALEKEGAGVTYYKCSSDPGSLDGIYIEDIGVGIVDATKPHALEPRCAGGLEDYINFSEFWDKEKLKPHKEKMLHLSELIAGRFESVYRGLKACKCLWDERYNIAFKGVNPHALELRGARMAAREITGEGKGAKLKKRFLTAFAKNGVITEFDTVKQLAQKVYVLEDNFGFSQFLLNPILKKALKQNFEVIACYCALTGDRLEHVIIPELSLAFVTSNRIHAYPHEIYRRKRIDHMIDAEVLRRNRVRIRFLNRTIALILDECFFNLAEEGRLHDDLEAIYYPAMNFPLIDQLRDGMVKRLVEKYKQLKN